MGRPIWGYIAKSLAVLSIAFLMLSGCAAKRTSLKKEPVTQTASVAPAAKPAAADSSTFEKTSEKEDALDDDLAADFDDGETTAPAPQVADPLEPVNRVMFHFNDKAYYWVLKPVARGYRFIVPGDVRLAVKNFFFNLATPIRLANCLLQFKGKAAVAETGRFFINSTVGILGFGNVTENMPEFNPPEEDLGQTLGSYGIGNGLYIIWPILGPSTLRDSVGRFGDTFLSPISYVQPWELALGIRAYEIVNETSLRIGDYEAFKEAALEPYTSMRNGYIQNRLKKVAE